MYEEHFGLTSRPFGAKAEGTSVFVGPNQTRVMTSLNKGLTATDAVITVTGPVGVGKTTIVSRALETISPGRLVAWVGRMQLAPDEVLDLLLAGFGVQRQSRGTIQRFAAFRRLLAERAATGTPIAIVVEDAQRIGVDALVEIEALTAADTADSNSANIILMGQAELNKLLANPELARLKQRNRLRQTIEALDESEVSSYLQHCVREAGGDYNALFENGVDNIVYRCSEGVPRVINTLCETALTTAAEDGDSQVSIALMRRVAADAFGFEQTALNAIPDITPKVLPEAAESSESIDEPDADAVTREREVAAEETDIDPPAVDTSEAPKEFAEEDHQIPELINDTHPVLKRVEDDPAIAFNTDAEATQTQKSLRLPKLDSDDSATDEADSEDEFSLDAALSVEAEETNVMPGITPNMDELAAAAKRQEAAEIAAAPTENIPTLSDSMRIDVEKEVQAAKEAPQQNSPENIEQEPIAKTMENQPDEVDANDADEVVVEETSPAVSTEQAQPGETSTAGDEEVKPRPTTESPVNGEAQVELLEAELDSEPETNI